jgi:hypothetical protein
VINELNLNFNDIKIDKKRLMEAKSEITSFKKNAKRNFLVLDTFGSNQKRRRSDTKVLTGSNFKQGRLHSEEDSGVTQAPFQLTGLPAGTTGSHGHKDVTGSAYNTKLKRLFKAHEDNPKITLNKLAITDVAPGKLRIKENRKMEQILEQKAMAGIMANMVYKPISEVIHDIKRLNDKHKYDDAEELKVIQKYRDNLEKVNTNVSSMLERAKKENISELNYKKISKY